MPLFYFGSLVHIAAALFRLNQWRAKSAHMDASSCCRLFEWSLLAETPNDTAAVLEGFVFLCDLGNPFKSRVVVAFFSSL